MAWNCSLHFPRSCANAPSITMRRSLAASASGSPRARSETPARASSSAVAAANTCAVCPWSVSSLRGWSSSHVDFARRRANGISQLLSPSGCPVRLIGLDRHEHAAAHSLAPTDALALNPERSFGPEAAEPRGKTHHPIAGDGDHPPSAHLNLSQNSEGVELTAYGVGKWTLLRE